VKRKRFGLGSSNYAETGWQRLRTQFGSFPFELEKRAVAHQHTMEPLSLDQLKEELARIFPDGACSASQSKQSVGGGTKFDLKFDLSKVCTCKWHRSLIADASARILKFLILWI